MAKGGAPMHRGASPCRLEKPKRDGPRVPFQLRGPAFRPCLAPERGPDRD